MKGFSLEGYQKGVWNTTMRKKPGIIRFSLSMEDVNNIMTPPLAWVYGWWRIGFLIPGPRSLFTFQLFVILVL